MPCFDKKRMKGTLGEMCCFYVSRRAARDDFRQASRSGGFLRRYGGAPEGRGRERFFDGRSLRAGRKESCHDGPGSTGFCGSDGGVRGRRRLVPDGA